MLGRKKGFTLIEMIIVMSMIAILALMSVSSFVSSRYQTSVDAIAQEILSNIRDAQNRSVSTVSGADGSVTKVWDYQINSATKDNSLHSWSVDAVGDLVQHAENTNTNLSSAATIKITNNGLPYADTINIAFASPFGRPYISNGSCDWKTDDTRPAQDWYVIASGCPTLVSSSTRADSVLRITITYNNYSKDIVVGANGDSYIQ